VGEQVCIPAVITSEPGAQFTSNTAAAQQPQLKLPDALALAPTVFIWRDGNRLPLQLFYDGPYTVLQRSLQIGDKTDKV
jgi:hypothetical protein